MQNLTAESLSLHTIDSDRPLTLVGKFLYFVFNICNNVFNFSNNDTFEMRGGAQALSISKYATAKLEHERGIGKTRTCEESRAVIVSEGFQEFVRCPRVRETYFFRDKNFGV